MALTSAYASMVSHFKTSHDLRKGVPLTIGLPSQACWDLADIAVDGIALFLPSLRILSSVLVCGVDFINRFHQKNPKIERF